MLAVVCCPLVSHVENAQHAFRLLRLERRSAACPINVRNKLPSPIQD